MTHNIKNVLVTGGAGFIGSHIVDELLRAGFAVRVMDNLSPPTHDGTVPSWLDARAEFFRGDVKNKNDWQKTLQGMDAVIHLAAYMDYHLDFSTYVRTNIESIAFLYELIVEEKLPIQKIIAASSQSVYGEGKYRCHAHGIVYPSPRAAAALGKHEWELRCRECGEVAMPAGAEEGDTLAPQIPYGISKLAAEQLLMNLGKRYSVPSVTLRYSIVLGPRQSFRHFYSGALRAFAANILGGEPIQMNEDGLQTRDFVSVHDVAKAHLVALENSAADFQVFNVGSGRATRIIDLAKMVAAAGGVPFRPLLKNTYRIGDARHSQMNVGKLMRFGWRPGVALEESIREYLDWVKEFGGGNKVLAQNYAELAREGILKGPDGVQPSS